MKTLNLTAATKELLIAVMESPSGGISVGEVRRSLRIIDCLAAAEGSLTMEDADFEFVSARFNATKFSRVSREVVALADAMESAKSFTVDVTGNSGVGAAA